MLLVRSRQQRNQPVALDILQEEISCGISKDDNTLIKSHVGFQQNERECEKSSSGVYARSSHRGVPIQQQCVKHIPFQTNTVVVNTASAFRNVFLAFFHHGKKRNKPFQGKSQL